MEYTVIKDNQCTVKISADITDLDYYTNITLKLCIDNKDIVLLVDNILFLKNVMSGYMENVDTYILDSRLDEKNLGLLLNEYYRYVDEENVKDKLILDGQNRWIGEKYCCFTNEGYATWLYKYNENMVMKVTPLFMGFEKNNYMQEYSEFIKEYRDVLSINVTFQQLNNMFKVILFLFNHM